ncbi:MAG TPA: hypothetical protein VKW04_19230 [Planctomycetota bacterium]|nr:hypothetical protein [Planctomycetota bacterium]
MTVRLAIQGILLVATALLLPACGKTGPAGLPGPSAGSGISYDNTTSGMAATTIQDAIDELDFRVDILEQVPSDSVHQDGATFTYTVPAGNSLVITFLRSSSASPFAIAGSTAGYNPVGPSKIVLNEGESVTVPNNGGTTPRVHGYLIPKAKAPGTAVHFANTDYTVPVGKTLYLTHVVSEAVVATSDLTVDGKILIQAGTSPQGETVYVPVMAGKVVSAQGTNGVHGYLK